MVGATRLAELAPQLKAAGLHRLTVSLDSLRHARFKELTRRDELDRVLGGIRGTFFFNAGGASLNGQPFTFFSRVAETYNPSIGYAFDPETGNFAPVGCPPVTVAGFRLMNGRASYGLGLTTSLIGIPFHFDWSWPTLFNREWEDVLFASQGGSDAFRQSRFDFWMGYDF